MIISGSNDHKIKVWDANTGVCLRTLTGHEYLVRALSFDPRSGRLVSGSYDKTVKVWDTARLERNVTSKPRHTYSQHHARVKCVCMLEGVHCFASAAEDGSLHIVRVHVVQGGTLPKYSKLQVVREHRMDIPGEYVTSMVHYSTGESCLRSATGSETDGKSADTASNLVYATTHSVSTIMDLRTMRALRRM